MSLTSTNQNCASRLLVSLLFLLCPTCLPGKTARAAGACDVPNFSAPTRSPVSGMIIGTPGDFNGDGKVDLAASDAQRPLVSILLGDDGAFTFASEWATGGLPISIEAGDLNGDGKEGDWRARLEANKRAFADAWVTRPEFRALYEEKTNAQYVDALIAHTGVAFGGRERDALVAGLFTGGSRARVSPPRHSPEASAPCR